MKLVVGNRRCPIGNRNWQEQVASVTLALNSLRSVGSR